jgi:hypothetical protein
MNAWRRFPIWTMASLIVAVAGNFIAAAFLVVSLFQVPSGSSVRLLGESFHSAEASCATLVVVVVLSIIAWHKEANRFAPVVALCLALVSFPFSGWAKRHTAATRGISLKS